MKKSLVALIPARKGSERLKNKNIVLLAGKPLIAHTISAALKTKIFDQIIVSTDSRKYASIAKKYGAEVPFLRPKIFSKSNSPDFEWVNYTLKKIKRRFTHYFILRPTNPFRTHRTIIRAWKEFKKIKNIDSLRAVELCKQHPNKMWIINKKKIIPLLKINKKKQPLYNSQYKTLPRIYVQNASLEISKIDVLKKFKTITGKNIMPFFTKKYEGYDINYKNDLEQAKDIVKKNSRKLFG